MPLHYVSLFIGQLHLQFEEVDSTNKKAFELLKSGDLPDGTCLSAQFQTDGKGQIGRYWHSKATENLLLSLLLKPNFLAFEQHYYLSICSALALRKLLLRYITHKNVYIKWPNDIYIENNKICGILIQNQLTTKQIKQSVIGIGLNVNQFKFPQQLPNPTSIYLETGENFNLDTVLEFLFTDFEYYYLKLRSQKFEELKSEYLEHMFRRNVVSKYRDESKNIFEGKIIGINDQGKLHMSINGDSKYFDFREIEMIL